MEQIRNNGNSILGLILLLTLIAKAFHINKVFLFCNEKVSSLSYNHSLDSRHPTLRSQPLQIYFIRSIEFCFCQLKYTFKFELDCKSLHYQRQKTVNATFHNKKTPGKVVAKFGVRLESKMGPCLRQYLY